MQVLNWSGKCSGMMRVYKCKDFFDKKRAYEFLVSEAYNGDKHKIEQHLKQKPFDASTACPFEVKVYKSYVEKKNGPANNVATVSKKSNWNHSTSCTSKGQVNQRQLLAMPSLRQDIAKHGAKASLKVMKQATQVAGIGTNAVNSTALWRAQRRMRDRDLTYYDEKFAALPGYVQKLREANPGSTIIIECDKDDKYQRLFVSLKPIADAIRLCGRGICSSDMGHGMHPKMHSVEASSVFKFGSGKEVPLWSAHFAGPPPCHENTDKWVWCATLIQKAGADLYCEGITHISDRCKGIAHFDEKFPGMKKIHCAGHLLENIQKVSAQLICLSIQSLSALIDLFPTVNCAEVEVS